MFHPCRGGVRGGKDQFTWDSVKTDKDRECYLGHSVMAPVGRWQQGKDIHWYNAEDKASQKKVISEEFQRAKEMEEKALMAALGYKVVEKQVQPEAQASIKQEYKEKDNHHKKHHRDDSDEVKIKKEKRNPLEPKGPQIVDFESTHALDEMLLKLVAKYSFDQVFDTLTEDTESKSKKSSKKSKHKKHHKSSKNSKRSRHDTESESSSQEKSNDDERVKKRKKAKHSKSYKHSKKSESSSSSSDSD